LRSDTLAPDGSLLLTTDNDNNSDWVLRVRPRG
jgi:glucose/arabinose dehydrogenase